MPENKNALSRYTLINQMLMGGRIATKAEIAKRCEERLGFTVSLRTIENDFYAMRYSEGLGYHAPIEYDHYRKGYTYSDPTYSIDNLAVDEEDLRRLRLAARLLEKYGKVDVFRQFKGAIDKVIRLINYRKLQPETKGFDFVEFEENPTTTGMEHINRLIPMIGNKEVVRILHTSFNRNEPKAFTVHPFYLKEYKYRWYVIGFCEEYEAVRIFGLERITSIEPLPSKAFTHHHFDPRTYFEKFIGVNVPQEPPEEVTLRFTDNTGKYLLTQPIHSSQKLISKRGSSHDFRFFISINQEFVSAILSWGDKAEVLHPPKLRNQMRDTLKYGYLKYE